MPSYYAVITYPNQNPSLIDPFTLIITQKFQIEHNVLLVEEYGRKGDNRHLNLIVEAHQKSNLNIKLSALYIKYFKKSKYSINIQRVENLKKLKEGYLNKEDALSSPKQRKIIIDKGYLDLTGEEDTCVRRPPKKYSTAEKMLRAMPKCPIGELHSHTEHCWCQQNIMSWVYDWCVEQRIACIPQMYNRLATLALQEKLPDFQQKGQMSKQDLKEHIIENFCSDFFS